MAWTTDEVLVDLRRRANVPDASGDLADTDLLRILDDSIALRLGPVVRRCHVEHWVREIDTALVAGQAEYRVPSRAMGGAIKDVLLVDAAGVESGNLEQVSPEQAWRWGQSGGRGTGGFVVLGAKVRLLQPPSTTSGSLRIRYYCRRSRLVLVAACGLVSTFNLSAPTVTITATPAGWGDGQALDFVAAAPQFDLMGIDATAVDITTNVVTFAAGVIPDDIAIGDYLTRAGETCVIPLPVELHTALLSDAASRLLEDLGYAAEAKMADERARADLADALAILAPRVDDKPQTTINPYSALRSGRRG